MVMTGIITAIFNQLSTIFRAPRTLFALTAIVVTYQSATAQNSFSILTIDGTARVQRANKRTWETLEQGAELSNNDLVETFFQTKLNLKFGANNMVIVGSNSKVLLNITEKNDNNRELSDVSLTLFGGGVFSKAITDCRITIYTANAMGVMDSGAVTTVAEGKTGETGFQSLGGLINVRNIAQQKGIELRSGLTTMIQPNKEPTAPLFITHRHVAVLKHYFGDAYITAELDASGIKPTDERMDNRSSFSTQADRASGTDEGMYRPLFNLNKIYGSILEDQAASHTFYSPITEPVGLTGERGAMLSLHNDIGILSGGTVLPSVRPAFYWKAGIMDAGIRLSFVNIGSNRFNSGFTSLAGALDKIDHLTLGSATGRWSFHAGELRDITFGYGLIVDDFTNTGLNNDFHSLGVHAHMRISDEATIRVFTSDVSAPYVTAAYMELNPSTYCFGFGYAADFNQYANHIDNQDMRYMLIPRSDTLYPDISEKRSPVHCYMVDFTADIADYYDLRLRVTAEFAQKIFDGRGGYVIRIPSFHCDLKKTSFGLGFIMESGRLLSHQFNSSYMDNRYRIKSDIQNEYMDSVVTLNNRLSRDRRTYGFSLFYRMNPVRGADIDFSWQQHVFGNSAIIDILPDTTLSRPVTMDFSFKLRAAVNDTLIRFIKHAQISLEQAHGRLFPADALPFLSWTFIGGYDLTTIPLFSNIALETGGRFFYFDSGKKRDDTVTGQKFVFEARIGANWRFK